MAGQEKPKENIAKLMTKPETKHITKLTDVTLCRMYSNDLNKKKNNLFGVLIYKF